MADRIGLLLKRHPVVRARRMRLSHCWRALRKVDPAAARVIYCWGRALRKSLAAADRREVANTERWTRGRAGAEREIAQLEERLFAMQEKRAHG